MKVCVIQPPYSRDVSQSDEFFKYKLDMLDKCIDEDIIVLPEYSDVPCATSDLEQTLYYHKKYIDALLDKCRETAKKCGALVFVNALYETDTGYRNTTYAFNRDGELVGKYFKRHLPPSEQEVLKLDSSYTQDVSEPYIIEINGLRYGFLTCYDFYFYETFARIARSKPDIIIGCSLQRSDSHDAIETMCRFLAYNTNAYVIRSSVSFAEDSDICGASMVVSPEGKVLLNMKGRFGMESTNIDPRKKYLKPAGFGSADAPHYEYIEYDRNPRQYRPAGSAIVRDDAHMPYPRVCAHRGFSAVMPENSMPSFGAAVAMGAEEIEFDLWTTKDGEWVSIHDCNLDRVSNGTGNVWDYTLEELKRLDFGSVFSEHCAGLKILTFEEILEKLSCHVIMNIHIKTMEECGGNPKDVYDDETVMKMLRLIDKYDCRRYVYFMTVSSELHRKLERFAPDIPRCMGDAWHDFTLVDKAIELGCKKVQLFKPFFNREMIDKAHKHGIICNVFWSDDPEEAKKFVEMGVDTVLSNDFNVVSKAIER